MIKLDKNYSVKGKQNNWILSYESDPILKDDGETYTSKDTWYYSKLSDLLSRFVDNKGKECKTAKELLSKLDEVESTIKNLKL